MNLLDLPLELVAKIIQTVYGIHINLLTEFEHVYQHRLVCKSFDYIIREFISVKFKYNIDYYSKSKLNKKLNDFNQIITNFKGIKIDLNTHQFTHLIVYIPNFTDLFTNIFKKIKKLVTSTNRKYIDCYVLANENLCNLKKIVIHGSTKCNWLNQPSKFLRLLENCNTIEQLEIIDVKFNNTFDISKLHNLKELDIRSCFTYTINYMMSYYTLNRLACLKNLRILRFAHIDNNLDDTLVNLYTLKKLSLYKCPGVSDIGLSALTKLNYLRLSGVGTEGSITHKSINKLSNIESLRLVHIKTVDISKLKNLNKLITLTFIERNCIIDNIHFPNLKFLNTRVSDITDSCRKELESRGVTINKYIK